MDQPRPERPDPRDAAARSDPSVQHKGRSFLTSMTVTWATVILLGIAMLVLIVAFAVA